MHIEFYDDYFSETSKKMQEMKDAFIRNKLTNNYIYKFISFADLGEEKIQALKNRELWASNFKYFEDKNEIKHTYDLSKISAKTGCTTDCLKSFINTTKQINDISCFTYDITEFMWNEYANGKNGFCLKFLLLDSDKFFPIVYYNKEKIDFTNEYIRAFNNEISSNSSSTYRLAILPWILKNECFKEENELRFLCSDVYDKEEGPLGGRILADKKESLDYKGISYSYDYSGIQLKDIIIGENCSEKYRERLEQIKNSLN